MAEPHIGEPSTSLPVLVDDLTELIADLENAAGDEQAVYFMRPRVYAMASRVETMKNVLRFRMGYRVPHTNFMDDPLGYFYSLRAHFAKVLPTLDLARDFDEDMFLAALSGKH